MNSNTQLVSWNYIYFLSNKKDDPLREFCTKIVMTYHEDSTEFNEKELQEALQVTATSIIQGLYN